MTQSAITAAGTRRAARVLIVEPDMAQALELGRYFARFGLDGRIAGDMAALWRAVDERRHDLVLLSAACADVELLGITRRLNEEHGLPVIVIAEPSGVVDCVVGLEMGADDYLRRPVDRRELVARIRAVLRRRRVEPAAGPARTLRFGHWEFDPDHRRVTGPDGRGVALSKAELTLLAIFVRRPRRIVSREQLLAESRGRAGLGVARSIDALVSRLRQKLGDDDAQTLIRTVRGVGYVLDARVEAEVDVDDLLRGWA